MQTRYNLTNTLLEKERSILIFKTILHLLQNDELDQIIAMCEVELKERAGYPRHIEL